MYKGGEFSLYYQPSYEVALWKTDGTFLKADSGTRWGNEQFQGKEGIGYGKRGDHLDAHIMPRGHIFTVEGLAVFPESMKIIWVLLGVLNSRICSLLLSYYSRQHKEAGYVRQLPLPNLNGNDPTLEDIGLISQRSFTLKRGIDRHNELSPDFLCPLLSPLFMNNCTMFCFEIIAERILEIKAQIVAETAQLDTLVADLYGISLKSLENIEFLTKRPKDNLSVSLKCSNKSTIQGEVAQTLVSYLIGVAFGRWDVRITLDQSLVPELPDPFDQLPVCAPGMLVTPEGLPAEPDRIVSEEWLHARPNAITLPPEGSVQNTIILDSEYPIRISWDGILADDPGFNGGQLHQEDIVRRTREVLGVLWKDKAQDIA